MMQCSEQSCFIHLKCSNYSPVLSNYRCSTVCLAYLASSSTLVYRTPLQFMRVSVRFGACGWPYDVAPVPVLVRRDLVVSCTLAVGVCSKPSDGCQKKRSKPTDNFNLIAPGVKLPLLSNEQKLLKL